MVNGFMCFATWLRADMARDGMRFSDTAQFIDTIADEKWRVSSKMGRFGNVGGRYRIPGVNTVQPELNMGA